MCVANSVAKRYAQCHSDTDRYPECDAECYAKRHSECYTERDSKRHAECHSKCDANAKSYAAFTADSASAADASLIEE